MSLIATGGYGPIALGMLRVNVAFGPMPRFEVAAGIIDGLNKTFLTSSKYLSGTTAVFLNGQLLRPDYENGWIETDPETGRFDMNEPPLTGDVVQIFFLGGDYVGNTANLITPLHGRMHDIEKVSATLDEADLIHGRMQCP